MFFQREYRCFSQKITIDKAVVTNDMKTESL